MPTLKYVMKMCSYNTPCLSFEYTSIILICFYYYYFWRTLFNADHVRPRVLIFLTFFFFSFSTQLNFQHATNWPHWAHKFKLCKQIKIIIKTICTIALYSCRVENKNRPRSEFRPIRLCAGHRDPWNSVL